MRAAMIENGVVLNVIETDDLDFIPGLVACDGYGPGDLWDGERFSKPPEPERSAEEITRQLTSVVQQHLDKEAASHGYDGILSLATYATSTNARFAAEGQAGVLWRDAVWGYCWQVMDDVGGGLRSVPTPQELLAELPGMVWPD